MKSKTLAVVTLFIGLALSASAFAQGRHDEKPHGMKPPAEAADKPMPVGSGRHDEKPHAAFKAAAKKQAPQASEGADKGAK